MSMRPRGGVPRYLWLTRYFPYPAHAGDRIYSSKLIEGLAEQDCEVTVFCVGRNPPDCLGLLPEGAARRVEWVICPQGGRSRMGLYPFSGLPRHALMLSAAEPRRMVRALLERQDWHAVIIDYVTMGWVLPLLAGSRRAMGTAPALVYVSHNNEVNLRRLSWRQSTARLPVRLAQWIDGRRIIGLERALLANVDMVTTITPADLDLYRAEAPRQRYGIISPGYDGPPLEQRRITAQTPRRVVVVGNFDWIVKQQNLSGFLEAAAGPFAHRGIGIDIVGSGPQRVLDMWRRRFPGVTIHGRVPAVEPYIQGARISIVPERTGGGFKLKGLDAVFQRSPIFAITGSIAGMPLEEGISLRQFPDFPALTQGVIDGIDDVEALDRQQDAAYQGCWNLFHWQDRARTLRQLLNAAGGAEEMPDPVEPTLTWHRWQATGKGRGERI